MFRGLTIAGMILVNTPGSWSYVYAPLRHAEWHGWTPTDLVFPFFLFIVGCAMWFSFRKHEHRPSRPLLIRIVRRTALIFLVGLALNAFPFVDPIGELRIMGVLQRIALAYGIGAVLCLYLPRLKLAVAGGALLVGYWLLLVIFGGTDPYGLETNLVRRVDLALLGADRLYQGFGVAFEPEGLLSTIPAVGTVIAGFFVGRLVGLGVHMSATLRRMILWGTVAIGGGLLWSLSFPINKPLWTSSYVLLTGGLAALFLAAVIWIVDVRGIRGWAWPFKVFGMNPLFAYALSILWVRALYGLIRFSDGEGGVANGYGWLYETVFVPLAGPMNGSLLFALAHVALVWVVTWLLYRRRIFLKL